MKKLILILILSVFTPNLKAQRITYHDLKYVLYHNLSQIEEYLSVKGFNYAGADTANGEKKIYGSNFKKIYKDYYNEIEVSKVTANDEVLCAEFVTFLKSDYTAFKNSIKKMGFIFVGSETTETGGLLLKYRKDNLIVQFSIAILPSTRNTYQISLGDITQTN